MRSAAHAFSESSEEDASPQMPLPLPRPGRTRGRDEDNDAQHESDRAARGAPSRAEGCGAVRQRSGAGGWNSTGGMEGIFLSANGGRVDISAENRAKGAAIWDEHVKGVFEGIGSLDLNDNAPTTAATAGPEWGDAQIMTMEGDGAGRMRYASVPPNAAEPLGADDGEPTVARSAEE
jgi:hypothetical protein